MEGILERVQEAGRLVALGRAEAEEMLDALQVDTAEPVGVDERLARLFVGALYARRAGADAETGNLYGGEAGPAEMLAAFEVFLRDTPLVRFAHQAANAAHLAAIKNASAVRIVDIGLGLGSQWETLLRALGRRPGGAPHVHLHGIDLPAPGPKPATALHAVGERLKKVATEAGVPFRFTAMAKRIEDITLEPAETGECLTINAAFVLHHLGEDARDRCLHRLSSTGAKAIVLCEPEADHHTTIFPARLQAALHHYGLVFRVLERCLPRHSTARSVIEGQFFGREIHNVIVGEGASRVERHAPSADWSRRLWAAGFSPLWVPPVAMADLPEGVEVVEREGQTLMVDGEPLVTVGAWQPGVQVDN